MKTDQEAAAKLAYEQNQEWQLLGRGRRDINQIAMHLKQPNHLILSRAAAFQGKEYQSRSEKGIKERTSLIKADNQEEGKTSFSWMYNSDRNCFEGEDLDAARAEITGLRKGFGRTGARPEET